MVWYQFPRPITIRSRAPLLLHWKATVSATMASSSAYDDVRAAIAEKGSDARVEVNQRALIDKVRHFFLLNAVSHNGN